jgi:hypothetical protein
LTFGRASVSDFVAKGITDKALYVAFPCRLVFDEWAFLPDPNQYLLFDVCPIMGTERQVPVGFLDAVK